MPDRKAMVWKKVCDAVLKAVMVDLAERIGKADALEGVPPQRITEREGNAVGSLVVVLGQGLFRRVRLADAPGVVW